MSYLSEPKDPAEITTVTFDFSSRTSAALSNPVVSIAVRWGTETTATLAKSGSATVSGLTVTQKFTGGAHLNDYNLKCLADTPSGDKIAVDCVLACRVRPVA